LIVRAYGLCAEPDWKAALCGEQHAVALAADPLAGELFAPPLAVDVGRVDQVDAGVDGRVEDPPRLVVGRGDALHERARLAEGHRAEAQGAHAKAAFTELSYLHCQSSLYPASAFGEYRFT
jgi:hypothetical protein